MQLWPEGAAISLQWLLTCICLRAVSSIWLEHLVSAAPHPSNLTKRQILAPGPNPDWLTGTYIGPVDKDTDGISNYDRDNFRLLTRSYIPNHYQAQLHLSNGYFGLSFPAIYGGFERDANLTGTHQPVQGWPEDQARQTFGTIAGFYNNQEDTARTNFADIAARKNESVIAGLPVWSHLQITTSDNHTLAVGVKNETISNYVRAVDFATNRLTTTLTWTPDLETPDRWFRVHYSVFPHHTRLNLAVISLEIVPSKNETIAITDILDGAGAVRSEPVGKKFEDDNGIYTIVSPIGVPEVIGVEYSIVDFGKDTEVVKDSRIDATSKHYVSRNESTIAQEWTVNTLAGKKAEVYKYVGLTSSDAERFKGKELEAAKSTAVFAKGAGVENLLAEQKRELGYIWGGRDFLISIPDQPNLEAALRTSLASLFYATRPNGDGPGINDNSIPVGGQTSDSYAGLVFWDAELWMYPGLVTFFPSHAMSIVNYRLKLASQALKNAKEAGKKGLAFPWTSGRYGDCTGTGPCTDYQYHLNTDIALMLWQNYCQVGNATWLKEEAWPVIKGITDFMTDIVYKNDTTNGQYWLSNMTDPDEYANHIDNGAFTMAGIKQLTRIGMEIAEMVGDEIPPKWSDVHENIYIPYDWEAGIILEYAGMNGSVEIKQADVTLINYPLEFKLNETQAKADSDFYGLAQSPDGPAMTWGISAINNAELERSGSSAYTYTLIACLDYIRQPFWQWSEQVSDDYFSNGGTNPAFSFRTGAGGCVQSIPFGFGGKRFRKDSLYINPVYTHQFGKRGITYIDNYHGKYIRISIRAENTTVYREFQAGDIEGEDPINLEVGGNRTDAGLYKLYPGQTIVVSSRRPDLAPPNILGNAAQSRHIDSPQLYEPGKYPVAAVDGNNATYWQPLNTDTSHLDIDLGKVRRISGISINWGAVPAQRVKLQTTTAESVVLGDKKEAEAGTWVTAYNNENVEITSPWDPVEWIENVRIREGNMTIADFDKTFETRFVRLEVSGSLNFDEPPTVAEVGIISR
ncbi:hypothetical protein BJ508DRAFT_410467 [Ascobolus immersus RN42]|uniref:alpha,alpha-trehalase n=1 Tax=Ascobolus immersus RN42 TaxID=1160509 RepID=A0A3N4IP98_ASCIM|nr:hypothetical protein BJ508DRAFT_410467 [Ascobolus immersus RN42]